MNWQRKRNFANGFQALRDVVSEVQPKLDIVAVTEADFLATSALTWHAGCHIPFDIGLVMVVALCVFSA